MEISSKILAIIIATVTIGLFTYAMCQMGLLIYHWHKVVTNVTNKYAPFLGGLLLLSSSNFNEVGQNHLRKAKDNFKKFLFSIIPVLLFMGVVAFIKDGAN